MVDDATSDAPAPLPRCMWCSAELPSDNEVTCPSCGATLIGEGESLVPGVTAIDAQAIVRNTQAAKTKSRSRLMAWLSGEYDEGPDGPSPPGSVSLPSPEVRREMLRLEIAAEVANLQAEAESIASENAVEQLIPIEVLNAPYPAATGAAAAGSPAEAAPEADAAAADAAVAVDPADAADAAPTEDKPAS
jgi:hypothetical protein